MFGDAPDPALMTDEEREKYFQENETLKDTMQYLKQKYFFN